jgi:hypothetical protein
VVIFAVRRRTLTRERGAFECSVCLGGRWSLGIARFDHLEITWWRVFSFAPRPSWVWRRVDLAVLDRRSPVAAELATLGPGSVVVRCAHAGDPVELAMSADAYTGFTSWLESAPPGPSASVT